jgi:hypothetical protein
VDVIALIERRNSVMLKLNFAITRTLRKKLPAHEQDRLDDLHPVVASMPPKTT